jgi:membrane fusion protein, multidrug efflux system
MKRFLALFAAALAGAAVTALAVSGRIDRETTSDGRPQAAPRIDPVAVTIADAIEQPRPRTLDVTGALMADAQTDVAAEIAGRVVQVLVERGDQVRAGAVLARVDDLDARNQLREAEAVERQMRERLGLAGDETFDPARTPDARRTRLAAERAETEERRYARLVEDGSVSRSDYETRRTEAHTAREQYLVTLNQMRELAQAREAQRVRVEIARKAVADAVVRAPWDGIVAERHVQAGQYLARGARVATVVKLDPLRVELMVPEAATAAVQRGQRVWLTVQTFPDRRFEGAVAYVGPALRPDARALVVEAIVANRAGELRPGLFATARIELPAKERTVLVPAAAIRTDAGVSRLFVARDTTAELRFVQIGSEVQGLVEVVRGVRAGERIITRAPDTLADGAAITVTRGEGR